MIPFRYCAIAAVSLVIAGCGPDAGSRPGEAAASEGARVAKDGPPDAARNPFTHAVGDAAAGKDVFRFETFGNEKFWTDALRLPQGMRAAKFTPIQALKAGLNIDIDKLDSKTKSALAAELKTDLSPKNAPLLNDPRTTLKLVNANAVIGIVPKDTNRNGKMDVENGDKVGVSCALCHAVTDRSVFDLPGGGSIGKRVDGPTPHTLDVGAAIALAANSRAFYPLLQLSLAANGGKTIGRAPQGLTKDSTEAEVDAYLKNKDYYPIGMFDDVPDGNGAPMHITPMFRADLSAPWGSEGSIATLDNFSNLVYTVLFDPTILTTPGGRALLHKLGGAAGDEIADNYAAVLAATGVKGPFPYVTSTSMAAGESAPAGRRVDNKKLLDMNAYMNSLPAPGGAKVDVAAAQRGREIFRRNCTSCHNVDQSKPVPKMIVPIAKIWPGYTPTVMAQRQPPLDPIQNSPGTFDDKMVVFDASQRGDIRGIALPLLLDLARKPVFLHDNSVPTLEALLDPARGPMVPHPFYIEDRDDRADMVAFLKGLGTEP